MINKIKNTIESKYYRYEPNKFLPVFSGGEMLNKSEFHAYRIRTIIARRGF